MKCTPFAFPGGSGFICRRGGSRTSCSVPGCSRPSTKLCDHALTGSKAGKTCDRPLCDSHARRVGTQPREQFIAGTKLATVGGVGATDSVDLCPAHFEATRKALPGTP